MGQQSEHSPLDETFDLESVIKGLAFDLTELRAGRISVEDAKARAELGKQIMNGVRLVINARKSLESNARQIGKEKP